MSPADATALAVAVIGVALAVGSLVGVLRHAVADDRRYTQTMKGRRS